MKSMALVVAAVLLGAVMMTAIPQSYTHSSVDEIPKACIPPEKRFNGTQILDKIHEVSVISPVGTIASGDKVTVEALFDNTSSANPGDIMDRVRFVWFKDGEFVYQEVVMKPGGFSLKTWSVQSMQEVFDGDSTWMVFACWEKRANGNTENVLVVEKTTFRVSICKCDGIDFLKVTYNGESGVDIKVENKNIDDFTVQNVQNGDMIVVPKADKDKLSGDAKFIIDGVETKIHVSCSRPLDVGDVFGDFEVVDLNKILKQSNA